MTDVAPATSAPGGAAPPAAPPQAAPDGAKVPPPGPATSPDAASADAAKAEAAKAPPPGETPQEKMARISRASRAARVAAAQNRELLARNQQLQAQAQTASRTAQTAEQQMAQLREMAAKDPLGLAKMLGMSHDQMAKAMLAEGTPEAQAEARIRAAEERAAKAEQAVERFVAEQQTARNAATLQQATEAFVQESADVATFPHVAAMPPAARLAWARDLLAEDRRRAQAMGIDLSTYQPTNKQLLAHMEKLAASNGGPSKAATAAAPDESKPGPTTPQTVTNGLTSAKYTLPADFDKLTDAQQKAHLARMLEDVVPGAKKKPRK